MPKLKSSCPRLVSEAEVRLQAERLKRLVTTVDWEAVRSRRRKMEFRDGHHVSASRGIEKICGGFLAGTRQPPMISSEYLRAEANRLAGISEKLNTAADALDACPANVDSEMSNGRDVIHAILSKVGPMTKTAIAEHLSAIVRKMADSTLMSYLSRDNRLKRVGNGKWRAL